MILVVKNVRRKLFQAESKPHSKKQDAQLNKNSPDPTRPSNRIRALTQAQTRLKLMQKVDKRIENHNATTYRTRHLSDDQLSYLNKTKNPQEKRIARVFFKNPDTSFGPTHIHKLLFPNFPASAGDHPITSTRRAINNLTSAGILQKTDSTTSSLLGGVEHRWRWRSPQEQPETKPLTHRELLEKHAGKQMDFHGLWEDKV